MAYKVSIYKNLSRYEMKVTQPHKILHLKIGKLTLKEAFNRQTTFRNNKTSISKKTIHSLYLTPLKIKEQNLLIKYSIMKTGL